MSESDDECGGRCLKARLGVWRKVPESESWTVEKGAGKRACTVEEGAGKRGLECGGRCRKARPGLWREVPESEASTVDGGIMYHGHRRSSRNVRKEKAWGWGWGGGGEGNKIVHTGGREGAAEL